ncbi:hypothetical protein D3C86_83550 [compost metagenome]
MNLGANWYGLWHGAIKIDRMFFVHFEVYFFISVIQRLLLVIDLKSVQQAFGAIVLSQQISNVKKTKKR